MVMRYARSRLANRSSSHLGVHSSSRIDAVQHLTSASGMSRSMCSGGYQAHSAAGDDAPSGRPVSACRESTTAHRPAASDEEMEEVPAQPCRTAVQRVDNHPDTDGEFG